MKHPSTVLLRIRPSLPDQEEVSASRGPVMMESVMAALHSLKGKNALVSLEVGYSEGKIALFARAATKKAASLLESQLYGQYPDAEIEILREDPFIAGKGETVLSCDLTLDEPEIYPIKRHPQFYDLATRQTIDTIAGITSALVRYPKLGMRGHVQIVFRPLPSAAFRRKALRFIPLLTKGIAHHVPAYGRLFTRVHLARGWKKPLLMIPDFFMGGFRTMFMTQGAQTKVSLLTGADTIEEIHEEEGRASTRTHDREDPITAAVDKVNHLLFGANIRISVIAPKSAQEEAEAKVEEIEGSFKQFNLPQCNGFGATRIRTTDQILHGFRKTPYLLSSEEIATLWHVPNILVKTPNMDYVMSKKLEPPVDLPVIGEGGVGEEELTVLGEAVFRGHRTKFGIRQDDRRRHMYMIGKTGMGKSTVLENMILSDIHAGKGVAVIDPHGDLVDAILRYIPSHRTNDVVLFDPADKEHPISFNMLSCENPEQRPLVASGLMSVFMKLWPDAFSGRMEYILRNALLALLEAGNNSMLGILRIFVDAPYRSKIMEHTSNHLVKTFWETEYTSWSDKYRTEAVAAIQNKIGQLLSTPLIRNIVGQVQSKLDLRHAMDTGKIVLVNLSKGKLGEDTSAFLGSMLVTKFQLDAMSRADVPENERRDFYLYVDEFQNFATESFASILSEARKYRLNLTMANQFVTQLILEGNNPILRDAVFGNVGSLVSFQVGSEDAEVLSEQYEGLVLPKDIVSLPKYHAYMRLMIKGMPSKPFSVSTLPPPDFSEGESRIATIRKLSRERYSEKRGIVEEKISKWLATAQVAAQSQKSLEKQKEKEEEEKKKAKAKGMSLADYRQWRDREMWTNEFNSLRKKEFLGEALSDDEKKKKAELEKNLEESGGIPPPSKTMMEGKTKKKDE